MWGKLGKSLWEDQGTSFYSSIFFSKKVWVYFLMQKFEVFTNFKFWKAEVKNQT